MVNAGGIISVMAEYAGEDESLVRGRVMNIPARTDEILAYSEKRNLAANMVADRTAQTLIGRTAGAALSAADARPIRPVALGPRDFAPYVQDAPDCRGAERGELIAANHDSADDRRRPSAQPGHGALS